MSSEGDEGGAAYDDHRTPESTPDMSMMLRAMALPISRCRRCDRWAKSEDQWYFSHRSAGLFTRARWPVAFCCRIDQEEGQDMVWKKPL